MDTQTNQAKPELSLSTLTIISAFFTSSEMQVPLSQVEAVARAKKEVATLALYLKEENSSNNSSDHAHMN